MGLIKNTVDYSKRVVGLMKKDLSLWQQGREIIDTFSDYWDLNAGIKNTTSWVESCVNTWGNFYAAAKFRLYKKLGDGRVKEIFDHPFVKMMEAPNNFQTWWEHKYFIAVFQAYFGNMYFLKLRDRMGVWRGQQILDPMCIRAVSSDRNFIEYYEYNINGKDIKLDPKDVVHIRYPSAGSQVKGQPLIASIMDQIDVDKYQTALQKTFYQNGGFMGQTWTTSQQLSKVSFNNAKAQLEQRIGSGNFKFGLFDGGLQPVKSAYSIKDMDIAEQRKLTMQEILSAFRIPQILVGGASDTYNRASAEAGIYSYASTFIDPGLSYIDDVYTRHIKFEFSDKFFLKHDLISPRDIQVAMSRYKSMTGMGALTVNELRTEEDYEEFDYPLAKVPLINVGGAVIRLDTGEQLGAVPNNKIKQEE